ncbi:hypothetical protein PMAYCL1PPCAC_02322, partial [Pristionchus mayeri]
VNAIFKPVDFGGIRGINFMIAGFKIWKYKEEPFNPFKEETTDSDEFLRWHAKQDHSKYCLSFLFTFRYGGGTIHGLAFSCFLCTLSTRGESYNTGMITFRTNGNEDPRARWHLTLALELGHSLGSEHDQQVVESGMKEYEKYPECASTDEQGDFLMHPFANDGYKKNNHLFSPCSIRNITRNLRVHSYFHFSLCRGEHYTQLYLSFRHSHLWKSNG